MLLLRAFYIPLPSSNQAKTYRISKIFLKFLEKSKILFRFLYHCLNMIPFKKQFEHNFKLCTYILFHLEQKQRRN